MEELKRLMKLMELKDVKRYKAYPIFEDSTADHVYGLMAMAEFFFDKVPDLDRYKVMKLILYHDMVEIETGDFMFNDDRGRENKAEVEAKAMIELAEKIPEVLKDDFITLSREYNNAGSREAKFVKAIDKLEPMIHCTRNADVWKSLGWTEKFLRSYKDKYFEPFPEIMDFWNKSLNTLKENGYIK